MLIQDRGLIFDATPQPSSQRIAFFTSLCPLRSGAMLAGFQVGSGKHSPDATIRICRSDDAGVTWREWSTQFETRLNGVPGSLAAPELVEIEPGRLLLFATWFDRSDPSRPLFDPVTEGILRSKLLRAVSTDGGRTWSPWESIPTPGLTGCASTGPIVCWPDGTIAYPFESFKEFDDPRPARHAAWLVVSRDGGRTFSEPLLVAQHPEHKIYYWDQRLCPTRTNGEFVASFWTHDLEHKRDLRVHQRRGTIDGRSIHSTPIHETTIPGQIAAPLHLDDGRLLAFVVDRARPGTMKLWASYDGGASWPESECLLVHSHEERAALTQGLENIDFKQYWEDMGKWSFGHPAIRSLGDGRVLVAWYAGTPDAMSIHWARIQVR
jgi:hypothetical protein